MGSIRFCRGRVRPFQELCSRQIGNLFMQFTVAEPAPHVPEKRQSLTANSSPQRRASASAPVSSRIIVLSKEKPRIAGGKRSRGGVLPEGGLGGSGLTLSGDG